MKTSYEDLHRLFRDSISAREIAEPLATFDADQSAKRVNGFMTEKGFDVIGVSSDGAMLGYIKRSDLNDESGTLKEFVRDFSEVPLLDEKTPLLETLNELTNQHFIFLRFLGSPSAIVTRSDLQKAPVRMWLFGLISILEMQLLQLIKNREEGNWWVSHLKENRINAADRIFKERLKKKEDISLADCLQICDKRDIFLSDSKLFELTGFDSKNKWSEVMSDIEKLRNNLAHSNQLDTDSWPNKAKLAKRIEDIIRKLEKSHISFPSLLD
tara:strand:+ start:365 stop:1171 length:807 start_codon:yes stop_codon:yes gene_type:complete